MATNNFRPRKFEDFEIVDKAGKMVGTIRVKPSGVLWARKSTHDWRGVTLEQFGQFVEEHGKKQTK